MIQINHVAVYITLVLAFSAVPAISGPTRLESAGTESESEDHSPTVPPQANTPKIRKQPIITSPKSKGSPVCTVGSSHNTHTKSMTLSDLNRIINIVHPVINNTHHHDNKYLITNYGETIYYRNDHNNIYHRFIDDVTLNRIPRPSTIWTSHSPCLACSRSLMLEYGKPETIKPTLRLATIDLGSSLLDTVNSLKCMAKLVHLNITILPWDWTEIRNNVHRAECIQSIDTAQRDLGFTYSQNEVRKIIEFINELSHNPQVSTWCELFSP